MALASECDEVKFYIPQLSSGVGPLIQAQAEQGSISKQLIVKQASLDAEMNKLGLNKLTLMKIDVEGGELGVMLGAGQILSRFKPLIWFEMNPTAQTFADTEQEEIFQVLRDLGYSYFYDIECLITGVSEQVTHVTKLTNILASTTNVTLKI